MITLIWRLNWLWFSFYPLFTIRQLTVVVQRLKSCQYQRDQAEARLSELQKQTSSLPRVFPWPGLGERRQAVEQARTLLDQTTALAPVLSDVRTQVNTSQEFNYVIKNKWDKRRQVIKSDGTWRCVFLLKAAELFEITQDRIWSDPSWAAEDESIPALLKELTVSSTFNIGLFFGFIPEITVTDNIIVTLRWFYATI